jgi:glycosyltransferase involved in cell wall biosynthesis
MKVLVLTTRVPYIHGGAEELRDHLVRNLRREGVQAEAMSLPFTWEPADTLLDEMAIARCLEVANADRVIALKFPAYLVPHHNKVLWVLHQYRQAYDLWDAGQTNIPATERGDAIRAMIRTADNQAFAECKALFANSPVTAGRLAHYNGAKAEVLPCPLNDPELFTGGPAGGYIFAGGRVGRGKRQHLLVQALRHAPGVRLVIAGPPDSPAEAEEVRRLAADLGVESQVTFDLRFLSRAELASLVNNASGVVYIPFDEDSVGYVTQEAFEACKPVITTTDSGGVLQIVKHGQSGLVAEPTPEAIGAAFRTLMSDPAKARQMGAAGQQIDRARNADWPATIARLLS